MMGFATIRPSCRAQDVVWVWVGLHHGLAIAWVNIVNCQLTTYTVIMIKTIKHRGLRRLYEDNDSSAVLSQTSPRSAAFCWLWITLKISEL